MHQANSSTSSSEREAASSATRSSVAAAFCWALVWLVALEAGCQVLNRVAWLHDSAIGRPLSSYLQRGESIERRLRIASTSDEPTARAMVDAGWIDRSRWKDFPSQREPGSTHLVAFYGNSFTRQISNQVERLDPAIDVRMIFGPVAPASHAFACFEEDRTGHQADAVVLGVVTEMIPGLLAMTRSTESVVEPSPYTFPRYRLDDGKLEVVEPSLRRSEDFFNAMEDPQAWSVHLAQLARNDEFYSPIVYNESWHDELALARMLKAAWAIRRHRSITGPVLDGLSHPESSEEIALLLELFHRFDEHARSDGRRPLVLLIDTPLVSPRASAYLRDQLAASKIATVVAADSCAGDAPASFAWDGHLSERCAALVGEQVRDWIVGP